MIKKNVHDETCPSWPHLLIPMYAITVAIAPCLNAMLIYHSPTGLFSQLVVPARITEVKGKL